MEFHLITETCSYPALITNIFSTNYLGMPNSYRMMLYVDGHEGEILDITKRVFQLAVCIIKYCGKSDSPHQEAGKEHKYSYRFSITGQKDALNQIRLDLGLIGEDMEEEIEDFDEPMDGAASMLAGLGIK